jgi:hypothetical protein
LGDSVIRDALGLSKCGGIYKGRPRDKRRVIKNVVLDAEMVAFSDRIGCIDGE